MTLRLRFNQDMYQRVCLVRTESPLRLDDLDALIQAKHREGELKEFLDEAGIIA